MKVTSDSLPSWEDCGGVSASTRSFILQHRNDDVRALALKSVGDPQVNLRQALEQIAGWQKARLKLPLWADTEGIVYPPHISMEQCSSQRTAEYKAALARRLTTGVSAGSEWSLVDLTGGFGVDFSYMAAAMGNAAYVERQEHLCRIARHNFGVLGLARASVFNMSAEDFLSSMTGADLIFLDPARRDSDGRRTFAIEDCTPDVLALRDSLLAKSPCVMVKLSPMLDWRKAVSDFNGAVREVHIVAVGNECRELLLVLDRQADSPVRVFCVNDDDVLEFSTSDAAPPHGADKSPGVVSSAPVEGFSWLCEPNAAVMKAGCFALVEHRYAVSRIAPNSNLFVSQSRPAAFPGRVFAVSGVSTMNRRELKALLGGLTRANITVRNFPLSVAELRSRLRLKDGGDCYLFATTDRSGHHIIIRCCKPE